MTGPELSAHHHLGYEPKVVARLGRMTSRGPCGPTLYDHSALWRAVRTNAGPATLRITATPEGADVDAWGPGAQLGIDGVPDLLGVRDRPQDLVPRDDLIARLVKQVPDRRLPRTNTVWEHLVPTILGQKVPVTAATTSWQAMVRTWGTPAPGPAPERLRLGPEPDVLATIAYYDLHRFDVERKRAEVIIEAARRATRLEEAAAMAPDDARRRLEAVRGIGPWTSSIVVQLALGDPDSVIVGDYNLPNAVAWAMAGERHGDDARMLELLEPYRGQRARVQYLIMAGGPVRPRRGPKLSLTDLSGR